MIRHLQRGSSGNSVAARLVCYLSMMLVRCPQCGKETPYQGNEYRPFCSERCKVLDLGAWADEDYAIPTGSTDLTEEDVARISRAMVEKTKNDNSDT